MAPKKAGKSDGKAKDSSSKGASATGSSSKLKPATKINTRHILVSLAPEEAQLRLLLRPQTLDGPDFACPSL